MTTIEATPEPAVGTKVTIERRSQAGELVDLVDLEPTIFGIRPNVALMHQVVTAQLAARRSGTQSTRTRSEVAGGGAKPYRQKGTGRARQGTLRAPQFAGGGVALGPKPRSYAQRTPRKMVRLALYSALSDRAAEGRVCLIDRWAFEVPKTKEAIGALAALGLSGRVLVVLGEDDSLAERSFANLQHVHLVEGTQLTAYEVLANDWVLFTTETVPGGARVSSESSSTVPSAAAALPDEPPAPSETADSGAASAPAAETAAGADTSAAQPSDAADADTEAEAHDKAVIASSEAEGPAHGEGDPAAPSETSSGGAEVSADAEADASNRVASDDDRRGGRRMSERAVLLRPVVSEKSYALMDVGTYVFVVDKRANKIEIRDAVQSSFGVRVASVNTMNRKGKRKRQGRSQTLGQRPDTKRAIVRLMGDDRIELFEG